VLQEKDGSTREVDAPVEVKALTFKPSGEGLKTTLGALRSAVSLGKATGTFQARLREGSYTLRCVLSVDG